MKQKSKDELKIYEIQLNKNPKIKERILQKRQQSSASQIGASVGFSASYVTESDDDEMLVAEERDRDH